MKKILSIFAALALILAGCSTDNPLYDGEENPTPPEVEEPAENPDEEIPYEETPDEKPSELINFIPIQLTSVEKSAVSECNSFAWRLFAEANANGTFKNGSEMISPLSVELCLSLVANAANGDTRQSILDGLGVSDINALNSLNAKLVESLSTIDNSTKVSFANSVWHRDYINIKPDFVDNLDKWYDAEARLINPTTVQHDVNLWCAEKTKGLIRNFPLSEPELIAAILLNATYFKGYWAYWNEFNKDRTQEGYFNGLSQTSTVQFMHNTLENRYWNYEHMSMTYLDFGNNAYGLTLILPHPGESIESSLAELTGRPKLQAQNPNGYEVELYLPKFKADGLYDLNPTLENIGFAGLIKGSNNFSNMTDVPVEFNRVQQVSSFAIDEDGVEAAAVTGGWVGATCGPDGRDWVEMRFDRPFIYYISERSTGAILFIGRVTDL